MLNRIDPNAFILDTGATIHCVNDKSLFESIDENKNEIKVTVANGEKLNITTQGSIRISLVDTRGKAHSYLLHNVCYHPRFKENLISVGRLWDDTKIQCTFGSECILHDTLNGFKYDATRDEKRHYRVALTEDSTPSPFAWTLHNRLGHCSVRRIKLLFENTIGVDTSKSVKKPVQTEEKRNKKIERSTNSEGIREEPKSFAVPYVSAHNGQAERIWGILLCMMRTYFAQSKLNIKFWVFCALHCMMLHNILPSSVLAGNMTPYESLHGHKPDISKIRVWGCLVWYVLEDRDRDSKIAPRAVPAVHLGRDHQRKGYHIYVPSLNRVTTGYHLTFQEKKFISFENRKVRVPGDTEPVHVEMPQYREERDEEVEAQRDERPRELRDGMEYDAELPTRAEATEKGKNPPRITRNPNPVMHASPDCDLAKCAYQNANREYDVNALIHTHETEFLMATDDTEDSVTPAAPSRLMSDVPTPSSYAEAISGRYASRWRDAMNEEIKSLQEHGTWELVERSKVPSRRKPTKSKWVYRVKLNRDGLKLCLQHFDVKSAFTQSDIDHEIYVDPPKGFEVLGVYVDDIILAHKNENDLKWFIDGFTGPDGFKSNHLGKLSWFLGSLLYLSCLTRPDIAYHMSVLCSMMHDPTVAAYDAAIDLLLYVRDSSNAYLHFPGTSTPPPNLPPKLAENIQNQRGLHAFSDASWHKPNSMGYNMYGYAVYFYGGIVSYCSKQIKVVALSSAEAEYAAAAHTTREVLFVQNMLTDLNVEIKKPTVIFIDNQAAIKIAENLGVTARNKHFEDSIHFFRHQVDHRRVIPVHISTKLQKADGFTKLLDNSAFKLWKSNVVKFDTC
ncbi:hypothetical protein AB1Y20_001588 [Prymnesium parvum]|uniref:Integrase catalytic domain-containing protein n=1 Tax=Prymnesium parvum TaxID=97485 RepID=A0AB34K9X1_PRYPA